MLRLTKSATILYLFAMMACSRPVPQDGFAGTWVMNLGSRVFIVLTLRDQGNLFTGQFVLPEKMSTTDGISFTGIGQAVFARPITGGTIDGATLRFTVENSKDNSDTEKYEMRLDGKDHAEVKWLEVPIAMHPFRFLRRTESESPTVATDWDTLTTYSVEQPELPSNAEMEAIYASDQAVRLDWPDLSNEQRSAISKSDAERRQQVRSLLNKDALHTGDDFRKAAFVFQHGDDPKDYLLAHTFALVALAKGDRSAAWIATATLDRYLTSIKQPQIYGTQFSDDNTHKAFDQNLVSDPLRRSLSVPTIPEQKAVPRHLNPLPSAH